MSHMESDSLVKNFDRWLRTELRSWAAHQNLPRGVRAGLMFKAYELQKPRSQYWTVLAEEQSESSEERSSVLARLGEPSMEFGLLSLRWVS